LGRSKEFDTALVLHKAMEVFGQFGYEGASMQELLSRLGIARQSLYNTFGTKRDLFIAALTRYLDDKNAQVIARLESPGSLKQSVRQIFQESLNALKDPERSKACYIINSAIEQIPRDQEVAEYIDKQTRQLETAFYKALVRAESQGELKKGGQDLSAVARFLNQTRLSLTFQAKLTEDFDALQDLIDVSLSVLD